MSKREVLEDIGKDDGTDGAVVKKFKSEVKEDVNEQVSEVSQSTQNNETTQENTTSKSEPTEPNQAAESTSLPEETPTEENSQTAKEKLPAAVKKLPKRKYVLLIAYCGLGFQGMQINPGANSIELHLHQALFAAGAIVESNMERLQKIKWMRCARTDKGVHAMGQIVSAKLMMDKDVLDRTNENLPESIRIFDFVQVTKNFNSKLRCDARTYQYLLRTEILRPSKKHENFEQRDSWTFDKEQEEKFRNLLLKYEGTRNFHNFTKDANPKSASSKRYIMEISLSSPVAYEGMEFVRVTLKGQSFMIHQIRKMIGTAAFIFRDGAAPEVLDKLMTETKAHLPMVPGLGLMLMKCHFETYNKHLPKERDPLHFEHCEEAINAFSEKHIYSQIYAAEKEEDITMSWLRKLEEADFALDYSAILAAN